MEVLQPRLTCGMAVVVVCSYIGNSVHLHGMKKWRKLFLLFTVAFSVMFIMQSSLDLVVSSAAVVAGLFLTLTAD